MADISKIKLPDGVTYNIKDPNATDTKVTQTQNEDTNGAYPVIFAGSSSSSDNPCHTQTESVCKSSAIKYNPNTRSLTVTEGTDTFITTTSFTKIKPGNIEMRSSQIIVPFERTDWSAISAGGIEFPHQYSETEQVVGYWTNGSPIYEKTVKLSSALTLPSNTWTNMAIYTEPIRPLDVIGYNVTSAGYTAVNCLLANYNISIQRLQFLNARPSGSQITGYTIRYIKEETT